MDDFENKKVRLLRRLRADPPDDVAAAENTAAGIAEWAAKRPCPTCGKPGHLPQDHAGWRPD